MSPAAFGEVVAGTVRRVWNERSVLVIAIPFYVVVVAVLTGVWRIAADLNGGEVAGYSAGALTWYIAVSEASLLSLNGRLIDETGMAIGDGTVAVELLRPASVLGVRMAAEFGKVLPKLAGIAVAGVALCVVVVGRPPDARTLPLVAASMVLAVSCNIASQFAFAASAFWLRDAGTAYFLYQKLIFILGGMLIPLQVFPSWLQTTAAVLPFRAMAYAPARLAAGYIEPWLLVQQAAWLGVLTVAAFAVFAAGERRLMRVGS